MNETNISGKPALHVPLAYEPAFPSAVTACAEYIFVGQRNPPSVHMYSWQGEALATVSHEALGLEEGACMRGLWWTEGEVLILASGEGKTVHALSGYRVSCFCMAWHGMAWHGTSSNDMVRPDMA
jgi:hypothetical protein